VGDGLTAEDGSSGASICECGISDERVAEGR
jgi:hypothetical protein